MNSIDTLLIYERFIPVMTEDEQKTLLLAAPSLEQLQELNRRLESRHSVMDARFKQSYDKIIRNKLCRKITSY